MTDRDPVREAFDRLRREEQHAVPAFASLVAGRPRRVARPTALAWSAVGVAAALAIVAGFGMRSRQEVQASIAAVRGLGPLGSAPWLAPTDALLETSGRVYLRWVPEIEHTGFRFLSMSTSGGTP